MFHSRVASMRDLLFFNKHVKRHLCLIRVRLTNIFFKFFLFNSITLIFVLIDILLRRQRTLIR